MATALEKKLAIKLLTERLERVTGKKVILTEDLINDIEDDGIQRSGSFENQPKVDKSYSGKLRASGIEQSDFEFASADHRDIGGLAKSFAQACKKFGIYVYAAPSFNGSDSYGFIISKKPMDRKQVNWADRSTLEE